MLSKFSSILLLAVPLIPFAAEISKWTDTNGKVHYGQIPPSHTRVTKIDVKSIPPQITEGEHQMRRANSQYFEDLHQKKEMARMERKKHAQWEKKRLASLERKSADREQAKQSRCDYHEKKIAYYEGKLRQGYGSRQGALYHRNKYEHEAKYRLECR